MLLGRDGKKPILEVAEYGEEFGFRPDTSIDRVILNFAFNDGGMGDFVNYAAATLWIAKHCPWIEGRVYTPKYLTPLMQDIHADYPQFKCLESETFNDSVTHMTSLRGPGMSQNGVVVGQQLLTVMHAHPMDVGFAYYPGMATPPGEELPILDYESFKLKPQVKEHLGNYCVITTGSTTTSRRVEGRHLNPIIEYIHARGLTPVFIGKEDFVGTGNLDVNFPTDIDYSKGIDLRNKTSVKAAACIMQHARFVLGLDNGLLHLAALMKDSKIIFGYNITSVEHRAPRRSHGRTINISLTDEELKCSGCQSKWQLMFTHHFNKCYYGDTKCIDMLFSGGRFERAIDEMLA